jgi:hypothetical protein
MNVGLPYPPYHGIGVEWRKALIDGTSGFGVGAKYLRIVRKHPINGDLDPVP